MSELKLLVRASELNNDQITAPPSKSDTHRALIAAALGRGTTNINSPLLSDDISATIAVLTKLGAKIMQSGQIISVDGNGTLNGTEKELNLDCGESGTTMRFLIPICALRNATTILTGKPGLLKRPSGEIVEALKEAGTEIEDNNGFPPVRVNGKLKGGKIRIRGDISSQFISGLLFALPLALKDSEIEITSVVESLPYIQMTLKTLDQFGISIEYSPDYKKYKIKGNQKYKNSGTYSIEGDHSSAAFLLAAGILAGPGISVAGLNPKSVQGDAAIVKILQKMGAEIEQVGDKTITKKSMLKAITIDVKDTPDLVPILAVIASQAKGKTKIIKAGRLRIKETDRLSAITKELGKMGAKIKENKDSLEISGPTKLKGAIIDPHNDHRIAMACTIAGLVARGETVIANPEVVSKSYPDFFYHMRKLGATILSETGSIGERFKITVYGGSHEKVIGVRISGIPKGTEVSIEEIKKDLDKRRSFGNLTTPRREEDRLKIVKGLTNGAVSHEEVVFEIENKDVNSKPYEMTRFTPRPNHGDYTTYVKYAGVFDFRGGGFLSARMTTCTVIAGSIAKQILAKKGVRIAAYVRQIGTVSMSRTPAMEEIEKIYQSEVRCPDLELSKTMKQQIEAARGQNDSLGGIIECQVHNLPVGIGEPIFSAIDSILSHYLFSIPAVKGVEFGSGFCAATKLGSENNDSFVIENDAIATKTNNSGGIQGGITNGMPLIARIAIKPTSSIAKEQITVHMKNKTGSKISVLGRHDPCVAIRAPIIMETMMAIAILDLYLRR